MCEYMPLMDIIQLGFYEFMNCFVFSNGQIWYHSNLLGEVHRGKSRLSFCKTTGYRLWYLQKLGRSTDGAKPNALEIVDTVW